MRSKAKKAAKWLIIAVVLIGLAGFIVFNVAIAPAIIEISEATVRARALDYLNTAASNALEGTTTEDLVSIIRDGNGNITMISQNTIKMNEIASDFAMEAQNGINELVGDGISIPIGTVIGGPLFTGKGAGIGIDIVPIGSVASNFKSVFSTAGINQTLHKVYISMHASVKLVLGGVVRQVDVVNDVMVSESVIVGNVPQTYLESSRSELLDLVP